MKIIISPALSFKKVKGFETSDLIFREKTEILVKKLKDLTLFELSDIIRASEEINIRSYYEYQEFSFEKLDQPAIFAFDGLVFKQFAPESFKNFAYLNDHLYILSGLFGALKPFTGICPYRLEMGAGKIDLYRFRGDDIYRELSKDREVIINLASKEYSKSLSKYLKASDRFISLTFKDIYKGRLKTIVAREKQMRGKMALEIINEEIEDPEDIKDIRIDGYSYDKNLSDENSFVFIRRKS